MPKVVCSSLCGRAEGSPGTPCHEPFALPCISVYQFCMALVGHMDFEAACAIFINVSSLKLYVNCTCMRLFALTLPPVYSASSGLVEASTRGAIVISYASVVGTVLQSWAS